MAYRNPIPRSIASEARASNCPEHAVGRTRRHSDSVHANSHSGAVEISALDAVFTAVSALCVTGLTTVDTVLAWTPLGHVVILALIQLGGLGIMFLASAVALFIGRRLTLSSRMDAGQENSSLTSADIVRTMSSLHFRLDEPLSQELINVLIEEKMQVLEADGWTRP